MVYGLLAVLVVAYLISELIRPDGETWPWLDNWGVAVFEIVASGLCILRGITARRPTRESVVVRPTAYGSCVSRGFGAAAQVKLGQDIGEVILHCIF